MKKEDKKRIIEQISADLQKYENFYLTDIATIFFIYFRSFLARVERLELPTPGFGDQCSTN
jgi:hypothetical protein